MGKIHSLPTVLVLYLCAAENQEIQENGLDVDPAEFVRVEKHLEALGYLYFRNEQSFFSRPGVEVGTRLNRYLDDTG